MFASLTLCILLWYIKKKKQNSGDLLTWKTLGALTREARADDRVAENVPAIMRGPNPDTKVMT